MGTLNDYAVVYAPDGKEVLVYDSRYGWCQSSNSEETKAYRDMISIYLEAYREARADIKADVKSVNETSTSIQYEATTGIEISKPVFDKKT